MQVEKEIKVITGNPVRFESDSSKEYFSQHLSQRTDLFDNKVDMQAKKEVVDKQQDDDCCSCCG